MSQSWHGRGYNPVLDQPNINKIKNPTVGFLSSGVAWCSWAGASCSCVVQSCSWFSGPPLWSNKERKVSIPLHGGTFSRVVVPRCLLADIVRLGRRRCSCWMVIESLAARSRLALDGWEIRTPDDFRLSARMGNNCTQGYCVMWAEQRLLHLIMWSHEMTMWPQTRHQCVVFVPHFLHKFLHITLRKVWSHFTQLQNKWSIISHLIDRRADCSKMTTKYQIYHKSPWAEYMDACHFQVL